MQGDNGSSAVVRDRLLGEKATGAASLRSLTVVAHLSYPLARLLARRRLVDASRPTNGVEPRLAEFARAQLSGSRFAHFFILCCGGLVVALLHVFSQWGWLAGNDMSDTVTGAGIAGLLVAAYASLYGEPFVVRLVGIGLYMPALGLLLATPAQDAAEHAQRLSLYLLFPLVSATLTVRWSGLLAIGVASAGFLAYHLEAHPHGYALLWWLQWGLAMVFGGVLRHFRLRLAMHSHLRRMELQSRVRTDPLTGLYNRLGWNELAPGIAAEATERGRAVSVLFFDVDRFKLVNDLYGHDTGDQVLQQLSALINRLRPVRSVAARLGGEEFVAILASTDPDAAPTLAHNVRSAFEALEKSRGITVSVGVARLLPGEKLAQAMKRSDQALYRAKQAGRNQVVVDATHAE